MFRCLTLFFGMDCFKKMLVLFNMLDIWCRIEKSKQYKKGTNRREKEGICMAKRVISIKTLILVTFIITVLLSIVPIGANIFLNWLQSAETVNQELAENINQHIFEEIDDFMHVPMHTMEIYQALLQRGIIDLKDEEERERFFVEVLRNLRMHSLYSFSYGSAIGEYYGARLNDQAEIEIMRNNEQTQGYSWYYTVDEDATAKDLAVVAGLFDPRTRVWYQAAEEAEGIVFSPLYKHFVMDDLTVSAAIAIRDEEGQLEGVLGAHIILSYMDQFLSELTKPQDATAVIVERETGYLIANSLDLDNVRIRKDGTLERTHIDTIGTPALLQAFSEYESNAKNSMVIPSDGNTFYINVSRFMQPGVDWLILSAVPEGKLVAGIVDSMVRTIWLTVLAILVAIGLYYKISKKLFQPIDGLIDTTERFSQGDYSVRLPIVRQDEIGKMADAFNKMADIIDASIEHLEDKITERTQTLQAVNMALKDSQEELQLLLDSTVEAIYGIDKEERCTFINASGLRLLGYAQQKELLGKNMHQMIHHSYPDGAVMSGKECKIKRVFQAEQGIHVTDEVFWRKDGTSFDVEYYAYPQYKGEEIIGAVVTFLDNTERKQHEEHIRYLSYHDSLTGLYNRVYFEQALKEADVSHHLPLSIIFGDVNGLKLTNDIFGHTKGDALLQRSAAILLEACRSQDIVARVGGDEFAMMLPHTDENECRLVMQRIKERFATSKMAAIPGSISLGMRTKYSSDQDLDRIMILAEEEMYREKLLERQSIQKEMLATIMRTLVDRYPHEKTHVQSMQYWCQLLGKEAGLSDKQLTILQEVVRYHDIGKIVLDPELLYKEEPLTEDERKKIEKHPAVGYRILTLFDETMDLAEYVLSHHENWDGSGYPQGMKGDEIPFLSQMVHLVESYEEMTHRPYSKPRTPTEAIEELRSQAGVYYNPVLVNMFLEVLHQEEKRNQ